jgi:phosphoglycolate phosphatase-like HAD superfamily hydrolase
MDAIFFDLDGTLTDFKPGITRTLMIGAKTTA